MKRDEKSELHSKMLAAIERIEACSHLASLIPEVRTNLVYARETPRGPEDVLAVDGRITVVDGAPRAAGKPKFGASSHVARFVIELNKVDSTVRCGANFASNPRLRKWLEDYCASKGWLFSNIDRTEEPAQVKQEEGASMSWRASEAVRAAGGRVPKLVWDKGDFGKEPMSILLGTGPAEVAEELCEIAELYSETL